MRGAAVSLVAVGLILAACGGDQEVAQESPPASAPDMIPSATAGAATRATPSASVFVAVECEPGSATSLSAGWQTYHDPNSGYSFSYPGGWEDLTGQATYSAGEIIVGETLAEAGMSGDEQIPGTLLRDPDGTANLHIWLFPGVETSLEVVYQRQEARFMELGGVEEVLGTRLPTCPGGLPGLGTDFTFTAPREDTGELATFYQRTFYAIGEGGLYVIQVFAVDQGASSVLDEVLRTWEWSSTTEAQASPEPGTVFAEVAVTAEVDTGADAPDPATFTATFLPDTPTIYVVVRLEEGVGGAVGIVWKKDGEVLVEDSTTIPEGRWAYHAVTPPLGSFGPGDYEVSVTYVETGESRTVEFTVADA